MKIRVLAGTVALAMIGLPGISHAQVITSIQIDSNSGALTSSETAGVDPAANWNIFQPTYIGNAPSSGGVLNTENNLVNSSGVAQPNLDLNVTSGGGYAFGGSSGFATGSDPNGANDATMLRSGILANWNGVNTPTFTLSGLSSSDNYSLIVYVPYIATGGGNLNASVTEGTTTYYLQNGGNLSNFVQSSATSTASAGAADYVEFTNITGLSSINFNVSYTGGGNQSGFAGIAGIQLVDNGAGSAPVPEPSTYVLLGLGVFALILINRRRVRA